MEYLDCEKCKNFVRIGRKSYWIRVCPILSAWGDYPKDRPDIDSLRAEFCEAFEEKEVQE